MASVPDESEKVSPNDATKVSSECGKKLEVLQVYKVLKQVLLVSFWICMGLCLEIIGPTLPDLKQRLGVNYEQIGLALTGLSVGYFIGSVIGGFLHERFRQFSELLMVACIWTIAGATAVIPWVEDVSLVGVLLGISGLAVGLLNVGGNILVMDLWGQDAASPMHSLHFGYGFGAIIVPQIARPFLSPSVHATLNSSVTVKLTSQLSSNLTQIALTGDSKAEIGPAFATIETNITFTNEQSSIEYPYFIVSAITVVAGAAFLLLHIRGAPEGLPRVVSKKGFIKYLKPTTCSPGSPKFSVGILACLFVYFIQTQGGERAYGKFLYSYALDSDNRFTKADGTTLLSVFWLSFTIGRGSGIIIAKFVPTQVMMLSEILGSLIAAMVLSVSGFNNATILWVFSSILGFFSARLFASGMAWSNIYLEMNSVAVMILIVGAACGGFIYQYTTGYLFEIYGARSLMSVMLVHSVNLLIIFGIMQPIASWHKRKTSAGTDVEERYIPGSEDKATSTTTCT